MSIAHRHVMSNNKYLCHRILRRVVSIIGLFSCQLKCFVLCMINACGIHSMSVWTHEQMLSRMMLQPLSMVYMQLCLRLWKEMPLVLSGIASLIGLHIFFCADDVGILVAYNNKTCDLKWLWKITQAPLSTLSFPSSIKFCLHPLKVISEYSGCRLHKSDISRKVDKKIHN